MAFLSSLTFLPLPSQVVEIIETFVSYMETLERCICIVYDASAAQTGTLGLKAIRLTDAFVETFRQGGCAVEGQGGAGCQRRAGWRWMTRRHACWAWCHIAAAQSALPLLPLLLLLLLVLTAAAPWRRRLGRSLLQGPSRLRR